MSLQPEDIHGVWMLDDWYVEDDNGNRTAPFGRDAKGAIMYTTDGYMSATIGSAERVLPANNPDDSQRAEAYSTYFNYAGTWKIDGDAVTHTIELALDPNLIGAVMTRDIEYKGRSMKFSGLMQDGKTKNVIVWKRR